MWVKASQGLKCPMERKPRSYISDSQAKEVPETSYYRRLINDGSLIEVAAPAQPASAKSEEGEY
jgi:hypothetical protein